MRIQLWSNQTIIRFFDGWSFSLAPSTRSHGSGRRSEGARNKRIFALMQLPRKHPTLVAALAMGAAFQAQAAFQAVETFDGLSNGAIGGQNGWVVTSGSTTSVVAADPSAPATKVLQHTGTNDA